ncbi:ABC transporter ATP-binding protein [Corynebacterium parakroppenstedtii]|uniref:ABC transporter ATP-binding protein n=1 Tax=Corynebacterium parakroppenstedtii TaxID=2828363 RepID=UPI001C8E491B|nr:ABC transporter ATP-binding protein [Corynebacterium parakroppenstedtii]MBY0789261.1 ABC transporter ATP-binding protein [Corynebacterium parakroppenstedtii]
MTGKPVTFWQISKPAHKQIALSALLAILAAFLSLAPVIVLVELVRTVLPILNGQQINSLRLWLLVLALVVTTLLHGQATVKSLQISHKADGVLGEHLRQRQITKMGKLPLSWFTRTPSGTIKTYVEDDVTKIHQLIAHGPHDYAAGVLVPVLSLGYMFILDWRIGLVGLVPLLLAIATMPFMMRQFEEKADHFTTSQKQLDAAVVELVRGIPVIKVFVPEGYDESLFLDRSRRFGKFYRDWVHATVHPSALMKIFTSTAFGLLVVAAAGPYLITLADVSVLDVLAAFLLINNIAAPLLMLSRTNIMFSEAKAAASQLTQFFNIPVLPPAVGDKDPKDSGIEFDDLGFSYEEGVPVLSDINEHLAPGSVTAVVGPSGSGKSTLASLIPRLLDPTVGAVRIGGISSVDLTSNQLYDRVGFVFQDAYLMKLSVRDNIRLANPEATDDQVIRAAKAAQIHERITNLPFGYDSVIGEDAQLSGGEQQHLAIARSILLDAPILVLDEATAFADPDSEAAIQKAISELVNGRTLVVIAHRLHTITGADRILMLEDGKITESGTHDELVAANKSYAAMWKRYEDAQAGTFGEVTE